MLSLTICPRAQATSGDAPQEGLRFPATNSLDLEPADSHAEATIRLEQALSQLGDTARLGALRAQEAYLDSRRAEWRALLDRAAERLATRAINAVELHQIQQLASAVERKAEIVRGEAERLAAQGQGDATTKPPRVPNDGSVGASHVRPVRPRFATKRDDEVQPAGYALPARLELALREGRTSLAQARRELTVVEGELSFANATSRLLESAGVRGAAHARDTLALERIIAESERVFLRALVDALASSLEAAHAS